jgi:iron-sulfur cluster assembly protein
LRQLIAKHKTPAAGIRVGVKKGGCNGYVYTMTFADKVLPTDEVVTDEGKS